MSLRWLLLALAPLLLGATNEWQGVDLTDGYGIVLSGEAEEAQQSAIPIRVKAGVLASDTTVTDVTWTGAGTPVGAVIFASYATAENTNTAHAGLSCGVTDFTTTASVSFFMEDGVADSDSLRAHSETLAINLLNDTTTVRSATVTAITDGIRITPSGSGTQYRFVAYVAFDAAAKAFSAGQGTTNGNTFAVTHGLGVAPKAGIYCYNSVHNTTDVNGVFSIGLSNGTTQRTAGFRWQDAQADGIGHLRLEEDRVAIHVNNTGAEFHSIELTSNTSVATTFTARTTTTAGDLIGLLLPLENADVQVATLDSPDTTGAWAYTDAGFPVGSALMVPTQATAVDTAYTDVAAAGTLGIFATDMDVELSVSVTDENAATTLNTSSRHSTELWLGDDDQTEDYACDTWAQSSTGFTADCDTADAATNKWLALLIQGNSSSSGILLRRRR